MSDFNNQYGGCFHSSCSITMANGNIKNIKSIKKGDIVKTMTIDNNISESKVICVVETHIKNGIRKMCLIDGLTITPWHPIYYNNDWCFPYDLTQTVNVGTTSMITFVLEKDHIVFINDVPCITLGHNFKDEVLKHNFYGTEKVIKCLQNMPGYEEGHIKNNSGNIIRDNNGNVVNIEYM